MHIIQSGQTNSIEKMIFKQLNDDNPVKMEVAQAPELADLDIQAQSKAQGSQNQKQHKDYFNKPLIIDEELTLRRLDLRD